jgi:aspartate aminotransferase
MIAMSTPLHSLNLNVRGLKPSATVAINERSNALIAAGRTVYKLGLGQSPFPVPASVVEALRDSAPRKEYMPVRGHAPLRAAVAEFHRRRLGLTHACGEDDVLVGPGSKELMFIAQLAFYGDLVLPSPSWVSYSPQARILGRQVCFLPTEPKHRWLLRPQVLHDHCARDPGRPRMLILNYPSNPTGQTYTPDELAELAAVARAHGMLVISDEIYGELHHDGAHRSSIAVHYPEGTMISSGLSKWCGAGGWRLGTLMFPRELRWLLDAMTAVASETYTTTSAPIQCAAVTAFQCGPEIEEYLGSARAILRALGELVPRHPRRRGRPLRPTAGRLLPVPRLLAARRAPAGPRRDRRRGAVRTPARRDRCGRPAGQRVRAPAGEWTARLAYVDFNGRNALNTVARHPDVLTMGESSLRTFAPRVVAAIEQIVAWLAAV